MLFGIVAAISGGAALAQAPTVSDALRYFDGTWQCDGVFPSNGRKISSKVAFTWHSRTGSLTKQHDDDPPNGYHAIELWAASNKGGFQNMIADSFGGVRHFSSAGWAGNSLVWVDDSDANRKEQFAYTKLDADKMRVDWSVSKGGAAFAVGDTLTCSRIKV
ncbi:MAG: hypothetical protein WBF89_10275 [Steroidobacteraceae bacterium]